MNALRVPIQYPEKLGPLLKPKRFKIIHGGRGGAKSHTVAQFLLALGLQRKMTILCCREVQKTLAESSKQLLANYIESMGLGDYYEVLLTEIRGRNGTVFKFTGLAAHTAHSIKSFEGVDICWIEEAHSVSAKSWNILIPTIRANGSEIWATFNPDSVEDYVYNRFVKGKDPEAIVIEINWRDNPWFPSVLDTERRQLKAINDDLYDHIWEGKPRSAAGILFKRRWFKRYTTLPANLGPAYMSSDYAVTDPEADDAVSKDPDETVFGCSRLTPIGDMYLTDLWRGTEDPEDWIPRSVDMVKRNAPVKWFEEAGVIHRSQNSAIKRALRERQVYVTREALPSAGSKAERALGFAARASQGSVYIPEDSAKCDWGDWLVNQLCSFTGQDGRPDDGVDMCSLMARGIDRMVGGREPEPEKAPIKPFTRAHFEAEENERTRDAAQKRRAYR